MVHQNTAAALIIGNEILSGKVAEQNLAPLAHMLRSVGFSLLRVVMIGDDIEQIGHEVAALANTHDVVFTSGGVGPTHDDVTILGVARAFSTTVDVHPTLEALIRSHFGDKTSDGHLQMARVPSGAELVSSEGLHWPTIRMHNVWILPGVPKIFERRLASIKTHLSGGLPYVSKAVFLNLDEGVLVAMLDRVVQLFPNIDIGSYPQWEDPSYRTQVTFDSVDPDQVELAVRTFLSLLPQGEPQDVR